MTKEIHMTLKTLSIIDDTFGMTLPCIVVLLLALIVFALAV